VSYRFLMCSPQYFDVSYVINPWMADNVIALGAPKQIRNGPFCIV